MPDYAINNNHEHILIAIHGRASWESVRFCLESIEYLAESINIMATDIGRDRRDSGISKQMSKIQSVVMVDVHANVPMARLLSAIDSLENIFVPFTRLEKFRAHIIPVIQRLAQIGALLEKFIQNGKKKRMAIFRSSNILPSNTLETLQSISQHNFRQLIQDLTDLVEFCTV
jgi:hypothetical protein